MTELNYVELKDGGYRVRGTRVSLDSVVYRFLEGLSPESIQADCFPTLTLEQVYGVITFYLANRAEVDEYLRRSDEEFEEFRRRARDEHPEAHRRLDAILESAPSAPR